MKSGESPGGAWLALLVAYTPIIFACTALWKFTERFGSSDAGDFWSVSSTPAIEEMSSLKKEYSTDKIALRKVETPQTDKVVIDIESKGIQSRQNSSILESHMS